MDQIDAGREAGGRRSRSVQKRPRILLRIGGWAGIAGPGLFTAVFLVLEAVRRGEFSPVEQPVSALEAGPYGGLQQVSFVVFGVCTLLFAAGLHRGLRASRWGEVGPALLGLSGVAAVLAAVFPLRQDVAGVVYDPGGHVVAGTTFFAASALGLIVLSRRVAADPAWRGLAGWTVAAGVLCVVAFVIIGRFAIPDDAPLHDWAGLLQRSVLLVLFPMRIALSWRLLRVAGSPATAATARAAAPSPV
jgi:hypothetical membrane protein